MKQSRIYIILACGFFFSPLQGDEVDERAVIGGGAGGAVGAAIGSAVGGREGAILGGAIGGATGAAMATAENRPELETPEPGYYGPSRTETRDIRVHHHYYPRGHHDNGRHLGHYKQKHKSKYKHEY